MVDHVQAFGIDFQRHRLGPSAKRLYQMRPDLGRLAAEILQIGSFVARRMCLASLPARCYAAGEERCREHPMKVLRAAAVLALLMVPGYAKAQQMPNLNLIPETASKTPEEKEADEARDKAYRESLRKIPDAKASSDPWGTVRSDAPAKTPSARPRTKTGSTIN
jgi:hypothetical protein